MVQNYCHAPHRPSSTQGCGIQPVSGAGPYSRGHWGSSRTGASTVPVVTTPATTGTALPRLPAMLSPAPSPSRGCPAAGSQGSAGLRGSACGAKPLPSRAQQQETPDTTLEELVYLLPLSLAKASLDPEQPCAKDGIISAGLRGSQHLTSSQRSPVHSTTDLCFYEENGEGERENPPRNASESNLRQSVGAPWRGRSTFSIIYLLPLNHHLSGCQCPSSTARKSMAGPGDRLLPPTSSFQPWMPRCVEKLPSPVPVCQGDELVPSPPKQLTKQLAERQGLFREMLMMPREELIMCHGNNFVPVKVLHSPSPARGGRGTQWQQVWAGPGLLSAVALRVVPSHSLIRRFSTCSSRPHQTGVRASPLLWTW